MTFFSKIMVAEKNNFSLILQMVISKCKNDKPWKDQIEKVPGLLLRRPMFTPYFHHLFLIFQVHPRPLCPCPVEVIKIYSPTPFKKEGEWVWTMIYSYNYWNSLSKCIKMKIFLLFAIIYSKINMNVLKTISPWQ